jgi:hypothetical protein
MPARFGSRPRYIAKILLKACMTQPLQIYEMRAKTFETASTRNYVDKVLACPAKGGSITNQGWCPACEYQDRRDTGKMTLGAALDWTFAMWSRS